MPRPTFLWLALTLTAARGAGEQRFEDVTAAAGIQFEHHHGGSGDKHIVEIMGSGGGFWDYDGDGDLDIYLANGAPLPGYRGPQPLHNALYRNEDGHFVDVTLESGLEEPGYSMGCAVADYDNDGDLDLYVTSFGPNRLYRNNGDGTFSDITERARVGDDRFGASAAFADIDNDGFLDLFVANYVDYALDQPVECGDKTRGIRTYCHPDNYDGIGDVLYRNNRDGTFEDVTAASGLAQFRGKGLGVAFADYDADGDADLYVANDSVMNFFFENDGRGRFEENALALGVGFSESGRAEAGMGVDFGDYDGDGQLDIFVTNFELETNTLYRNLGERAFQDVTYASGLAMPSLPWVGFGTRFFDMDLDGDPDLFVANGHVMDDARYLSDGTSFEQPNQLFENDGGRYQDISAESGEHFGAERLSRAAAFGDWDDDGDVDILVTNNGRRASLLRNQQTTPNHFLMLRLIGVESNRDGIGATVRLLAGGHWQVHELRSGTSYLAQNDLRLHFGLGNSETVEQLEIRWPSGERQTFAELPADYLLVIREGSPQPLVERRPRMRLAGAPAPSGLSSGAGAPRQ